MRRSTESVGTLNLFRRCRPYAVAAAVLIGLLAIGFLTVPSDAQEADPPAADAPATADDAEGVPENPFPRRSKAPNLEGGIEWLNTSGPIGLPDLRGKVVLLDFWTYCCINCIHVLPDLAALEEKYADQLIVVGVHSAKFDNEKDSENIRQAIVRYEIKHPVVNDAEMTIWRKFGVRSWPTLVLIDPEGYYIGFLSGEGQADILDDAISKLVTYHRAKGTLDEAPVRFDLERDKLAPTPLRYPGKLLVDEAGGRLFVSDSNHNRIVVTTLAGELLHVIGSGAIGAADGSFDTATFDHPQGIELVDQILYVADTENHLIRAIDLEAKTVATLAGTGEQDRRRTPGGELLKTPLNSPWDLLHHQGTLYIAMAGPHQLWKHAIGSETIETYAGTGREDILDGTKDDCAFAQPSGLASDGDNLYVADSEGSAIRKVPFAERGEVTTVVGPSNLPGGRSLFEFGDIDGVGGEARLQHVLGLAFSGGTLYVADSYNHKIKQVTLSGDQGTATTILGDGDPGTSLEPLELSEPAGLAVSGSGQMYIADTNNHRIVVVDMTTKKASVLEIAGLQPPAPPRRETDVASTVAPTAVDPQSVAPAETLPVSVNVTLPPEYKLNELAPVSYRVTAEGEQTLIPAERLGLRRRGTIADGQLRLEVPLTGQEGSATIDLAVTFGYCRGGTGGLCKLRTSRYTIPLQVTAGASATALELTATAD